MNRSTLLLTSALMMFSSSLASAHDNGNLAAALLFGYGGWQNRPMVTNNYNPPYFALHPPVYYGDRYYRPYGDSPFASWPQLQPNPQYQPRLGAHSSMAATIDNPHCVVTPVTPQSIPVNLPDVVQRTIEPLIIENPYFDQVESKYTSILGR